MRLRLTIQRPALATVKLVWNTDFPVETSIQEHRISDLLARVNDVVPLECDESEVYLTFYVVSVGGYECLHFQPIGQVVKEDDEVLIRHRTPNEMKLVIRSGRVQSTTNHGLLVDGTRFGSPFREGPADRPSVSIPCNPHQPARKKRRTGQGDTSEYADALTNHPTIPEDEPSSSGRTNAHIRGCGGALPNNPALDALKGMISKGLMEGLMSRSMMPTNAPSSDDTGHTFDPEENMASDDSSEDDSQVDKSDDLGLLSTPGWEKPNTNLEENDSSSSDSESQRSNSTDDSEDEVSDAKSKKLDSNRSQKLLEYPSSDEDTDEDMDDAPEELSSRPDGNSRVPQPSTSTPPDPAPTDLSSRSDSNSGLPKPSTSTASGPEPKLPEVKLVDKAFSGSDKGSSGPRRGTAPGTLPHQASNATKARNNRKKLSRKLQLLKDEGVFGDDIGAAYFKKFLEQYGLDLTSPDHLIRQCAHKHVRTCEQEGQNPGHTSTVTQNPELKVSKSAKKAFKKARYRGIIPEDWDIQRWLEKRRDSAEQPPLVMQESSRTLSVLGASQQNTQPGPENYSSHRKTADSSGRNLHCGNSVTDPLLTDQDGESSGPLVENFHQYPRPPSKRGRLHSDRRPVKTLLDTDGNTAMADDEMTPEPEHMSESEQPPVHPEAVNWRDKVTLEAVECEQTGIQLPKPDFPFHQDQLIETEWVPKSKKRNRKKRKRQEHDEQLQYEGANEEQQYDASMYDDPAPTAAPETRKDLVDFPPLPSDIESYLALVLPIQVDTVFAFKRFEMDSSYQPTITDFKRAKVVEVDTGSNPSDPWLRCVIPQSETKPKEYDPETGERILGRFGMPGVDDEVPDNELEINFSELMAPRILYAPPAPPEPEKPSDEEQANEGKEPESDGQSEGSSEPPVQGDSEKRDGDGRQEQSDETHRDPTPTGETAPEQPKDASTPEGQLERKVQNDAEAPVPDPFEISMDDIISPEPEPEPEPEREEEKQIPQPLFEHEPKPQPEPDSSPIVTPEPESSPIVTPEPDKHTTPQAASTRPQPRPSFPETPGYPKLPTLPETPSTQLLPSPGIHPRSPISSPQLVPPAQPSSSPRGTQAKAYNIDEYDTDSDGLPSLSTILSSQPVKNERRDSPASLPAIPKFSPLTMAPRQSTAPPPSSAEKNKVWKVTATAKKARKVNRKSGGSVNGTGGGVVKVIDLTDSP